MPTFDSRDTIHSLLEANQAELLLRAAIDDGTDAPRDGDVLRALMQASLAEGDMETVRATACRLVELGIADGNLMLAVEGLCLLRNVGGDTDRLTRHLLNELDRRGFNPDTVLGYVNWTPDVDAALASTEPCPPAATTLAILSERLLKPTSDPFAWVTLWPQLNRSSRLSLLESLHFEMRQPGDATLHPPRIVAAWVISGEFSVGSARYRAIPGTMITGSSGSHQLLGGRHLRMVGLRQEHWDSLLTLPDFQHAWTQSRLRLIALGALEGIAARGSLNEDALKGLLQLATISPPGSGWGVENHARILLAIDGHLQLPLRRDKEVIVSTVGPGTLLAVPAGVQLPELSARVLCWDAGAFGQITSLEQYTVVEVASAAH